MSTTKKRETLLSVADEPNVLRLTGSMDVSQARSFLEIAQKCSGGVGDVLVDGAELERLDASGLQVLLSLKSALESSGRALRVTAVSERVFGLLLVTGAAQALVTRAAEPSSLNPLHAGDHEADPTSGAEPTPARLA